MVQVNQAVCLAKAASDDVNIVHMLYVSCVGNMLLRSVMGVTEGYLLLFGQ